MSATEDPDRPYGHVVLHRSETRLRMSDRKYSISKLLDPRERGEKVDLNVVLARLERHTPFV